MKKIINGVESTSCTATFVTRGVDPDGEVCVVEFTPCTATYVTAGYTDPAPAIVVHDLDDEFRNGDTIVWDCDMPETEDDAHDILLQIYEMTTPYSSDSDDFETIIW